jgi:foldase protein PrsA
MRHASIKMFCALAVTGLGAAVVAGCGNDVPPNAVAKVGDAVITQDEFDKWLTVGTASQTAAQGGQAVAPDPPDFEKCVAAKKKVPAPKGQEQPSDSQLKKQCEQQFEQLKTEVMQFLIQSEWVLQEAEAQDIKLTDQEIRRTLEEQKKQAFPDDKAYQRFLKQSGMSEADILFRVRIDQLQQKLTQKITEDAKNVTDADVQEYYDKNKQRFAQPERRDLLVVLTKTKAQAEQAKRALEDGQSWKQVVKRYSIDEASKAQGGKLPAVAKGQQEKALDDAVFAASKGEVEGPVKTQFGWYVFEVQKVTPASQQTLEESEQTIRNLLRSQGQQRALDSFIKDFREDYKNDTDCADDYRVAECKNAPKESTETGPASGGPPSGQPQPQPQPQPQTPSQQAPQP